MLNSEAGSDVFIATSPFEGRVNFIANSFVILYFHRIAFIKSSLMKHGDLFMFTVYSKKKFLHLNIVVF